MLHTRTSIENQQAVALKHLAYCQANDWADYDPYDALNSQIFKALPFLDFRLFRLGFTQAIKRFPLNLRPLLLVPKTPNPKGIALFLMAFLKLPKSGLLDEENLVPATAQELAALRSQNTPYLCGAIAFPGRPTQS